MGGVFFVVANLISSLGITLHKENCHRFFLPLSPVFTRSSAFASTNCVSFIQQGTFLSLLSTAYTHSSELRTHPAESG